jgi:hypothetical protein
MKSNLSSASRRQVREAVRRTVRRAVEQNNKLPSGSSQQKIVSLLSNIDAIAQKVYNILPNEEGNYSQKLLEDLQSLKLQCMALIKVIDNL